MNLLLVFGSEDCPSWERTRKLIDELENDEGLSLDLRVLDPAEHKEQFRGYGLVICPSIVYRDEVISVGPPDVDHVKGKIRDGFDED